jgi:multicomponent Na+:H+ antiporter subunit G
MTAVVIILVVTGLVFLTVSCVGLVRLPDFYSRNHAAGKSQTLGAVLIFGGLAIYIGWDINALKLLIILVFFAVANPTATHAIARAAYKFGLEPWTRENLHQSAEKPGKDKSEDLPIEKEGLD